MSTYAKVLQKVSAAVKIKRTTSALIKNKNMKESGNDLKNKSSTDTDINRDRNESHVFPRNKYNIAKSSEIRLI